MNKKATKGYYIKQSNQKKLEKYGALLDIPHCKPSASLYLDILLDEHFAAIEKKEAKVKPKAELAEVELTYPYGLNVLAWDKWVAFRKKAKFKAYKTDSTMKKLAEMGSNAEQMLIVQNSIDMQYQGLFALKGNNAAAKTDVLQDSADSDWHLQDQGF